MKKMLAPRRSVIKLTGLLFAAYALYYVFILFRDGAALSAEAVFVSVVLVVLFGVFTAFAWTSEVQNGLFLLIRVTVFTIALIAVFALKLRMIVKVFYMLDTAKPETVVYAASYLLTVAALLLLVVYYLFILKRLPLFPRASLLLPLFAAILFLCSFILEIVLFAVYGITLEANSLRTMVARPLFFLGFIGLSVDFMFPALYPPKPPKKKRQKPPEPFSGLIE